MAHCSWIGQAVRSTLFTFQRRKMVRQKWSSNIDAFSFFWQTSDGIRISDFPWGNNNKLSYCLNQLYVFKEISVQRLISKCYREGDRYYMLISSKAVREKPVQIRPWRLTDMDYMPRPSSFLDSRRTVMTTKNLNPINCFADLHRRSAASHQSQWAGLRSGTPMRSGLLRGDWWYAYEGFFDCFDHHSCRWPGDEVSERGCSSHIQYLQVVRGRNGGAFREHPSFGEHQARMFLCIVEIYLFPNRLQVEIKPYVVNDQMCDNCHGKLCQDRYAPYFCGDVTCLQYYCEVCWDRLHYSGANHNREQHKPFVRMGEQTKVGSVQFIHLTNIVPNLKQLHRLPHHVSRLLWSAPSNFPKPNTNLLYLCEFCAICDISTLLLVCHT